MSSAPDLDPARIAGTWYIVPTPFDAAGAIDVASLTRLIESALDWGADGFTVLGVMGEAGTLNVEERALVLRTVVAAASGAPVAAGVSASSKHAVLEFTHQAIDAGAGAVMVAAPPLLRNVDALPALCADVAACGVPVIVQDEPAATGVVVPVSVLAECLRAAGTPLIKLEDPPTPTKMTQLLAAVPAARIFGGLGGVSSYHELSRGAVGTMTGFSFPEVLRELRVRLERDNSHGALEVYARFLPLLLFEGQPGTGLAIRKEVLRRRGALEHAVTRVDSRLTPQLTAELDEIARYLDIKIAADPLAV
jgi:4-hydroxy-tetrahydrodipicolinate synthase